MCQDTSLVDIPYTIFDTSACAVSVAKSCPISFYVFLFFSSYKACSFWNSDTLDAIVESAMLNYTIEYWISSSELPQNINIHGAVPMLLSGLFSFFKQKGNTCL